MSAQPANNRSVTDRAIDYLDTGFTLEDEELRALLCYLLDEVRSLRQRVYDLENYDENDAGV